MKKMSKRLRVALSLDDELYARHRAQEKHIQILYEKYVNNPKSIISVIRKDKSGNLYKMKVILAHATMDGTVVVVSE